MYLPNSNLSYRNTLNKNELSSLDRLYDRFNRNDVYKQSANQNFVKLGRTCLKYFF